MACELDCYGVMTVKEILARKWFNDEGACNPIGIVIDSVGNSVDIEAGTTMALTALDGDMDVTVFGVFDLEATGSVVLETTGVTGAIDLISSSTDGDAITMTSAGGMDITVNSGDLDIAVTGGLNQDMYNNPSHITNWADSDGDNLEICVKNVSGTGSHDADLILCSENDIQLNSDANIDISVSGSYNITADNGYNLTVCPGDMTIDVCGDINIGASGSITLEADTSMTLDAATDLTQNIGGNLDTNVTGDITTDAVNNTETYTGDSTTNITGNTTETVGGNILVDASGTVNIGASGNFTLATDTDMIVGVSGDLNETIGCDHTQTVGGNYNLEVCGDCGDNNMTIDVCGDLSIGASGTFDIQSNTAINIGTDPVVPVNIGNLNLTQGSFDDLVINGDLTVNGTTTTINSTEVTIDDNNIVLNDVDTPTCSNAHLGGIDLRTSATEFASIRFICDDEDPSDTCNGRNAWQFSEDVDIGVTNWYTIDRKKVLGREFLYLRTDLNDASGATGGIYLNKQAECADTAGDWRMRVNSNGRVVTQYYDGSQWCTKFRVSAGPLA